ncbi:MAG TPA: stage II sporulation protein M [Dehalococcoidales bacterium]|nr:stage II sporulation protein M [Dehalococcoidales bacterium]
MRYRWWLLGATFLFVAGTVIGTLPFTGVIDFSTEGIATIKQFGDILTSLPAPVIALVIFMKNTSALLLSFALSPMLCLVPVLALTINGLLLGSLSAIVAQQESLGFVLTGLLPHGVFELPALIIGEAAALSFGAAAILAIFRRRERELLLPNLKQNLKYLLLAIGLLIPAAIIETYVTPLLLG